MFKAIDSDGKVTGHWKNKNDLLSHIKGCWEDNLRWGTFDLVKDNYFLHQCCHNWNEFIPRRSYTRIRDEDNNYLHTIIDVWKEYKPQMIIDVFGRIMNIGDLAREAWDSNPTKPEWVRRRKGGWNSKRWDKYWALHNKRFRHLHISTYYRQKNTQQERRIGCDSMHKPYTRGKRNKHCLDPWSIESPIHSQITWKQLKVKRQWMAKQKENKLIGT